MISFVIFIENDNLGSEFKFLKFLGIQLIHDFSVYGVEVEMILDEIISTEEVPDYPVSQMLSDFGGVFGFCMGLSLLTFINAIEWAFKSVFKVKKYMPRVKFG